MRSAGSVLAEVATFTRACPTARSNAALFAAASVEKAVEPQMHTNFSGFYRRELRKPDAGEIITTVSQFFWDPGA